MLQALVDALVDARDRADFDARFGAAYSDLAGGVQALGRRIVQFVTATLDSLVDETDWELVRGQALEALALMIGVARLVPLIGAAPAALLAVTVVGIALWPLAE